MNQPDTGAGRNRALDGIRAVSIIGIMANHSLLGWATGGIISVNVFFVLSGFLITGLLVKEWSRSGTIRLRAFWARRARRLLPALLVLLVGIGLFAWLIAAPDQRAAIRGDALATLLYVANWHQIFSNQSYFALSAAPSPLLHTWTLAIEEQFYLVWPLVVLGMLKLTRRLRPLLALSVVAAVASAIWMGVLFHPGADPSRIYYGTDTRAQDVLVGACLALALALRPEWAPTAPARRWLAALTVAAAAGFAAVWVGAGVSSAFVFRGGFFLADVLVALVILGVVAASRTLPARALGWRPLAYIGTISYSLYLWHWPVFLVVNTARTGLSGWQLFAVRSVIAGVIAAASTHFIELPVRQGTFRSWRIWAVTPVALVIVVGAILGGTVTPAVADVASPVTGLTPTQTQALQHRGAFGPSPTRFLLLGDSQALTLGVGLSVDERRWGVQLDDQGQIGCDFDEGLPDTPPVEIRGGGGPPGPLEGGCHGWPATWSAMVGTEHPAVVGLLMGRWEVFDHELDGRWTHVGEPDWDAHLLAAMNQAVDVLSSRGAAVVLFTTPYCSPLSGDDPNGVEYVENQPARVDAYNALVRQVAAEHPGTVTVFDLNQALTVTKDVYTPTVDGVVARSSDGIHITLAGGELLRSRILPVVDQLALSR